MFLSMHLCPSFSILLTPYGIQGLADTHHLEWTVKGRATVKSVPLRLHPPTITQEEQAQKTHMSWPTSIYLQTCKVTGITGPMPLLPQEQVADWDPALSWTHNS